MTKNSGNVLLIILAVAGILAASVGGWFLWKSSNKISENKKVSFGERRLLKHDTKLGYPELKGIEISSLKFNSDIPNQTVTYASKEKGYSVDLPYNSNWGTKDLYIMPYDEADGDVFFGPVGPGEGGIGRWDYVSVVPQQSIEELTNKARRDPESTFGPIVKKINSSVTVVEYLNGGFVNKLHL